MKKKELITILIATSLTTSALYAPQPISPVFMKYFNISKTQSAFIMSAGIIPLSVAPILYGYLLEKIPPIKLLTVAIFFLSIFVFLFPFSKSHNQLVLFRLLQGVFIPASLVSTMTYLSLTANSTNIQKLLSTYIAFSVFGGFMGRIFSGFISTYFGWKYVFILLSLSLFICFFFLTKIPSLPFFRGTQSIQIKLLFKIIKTRKYINIYPIPFIIFFVFLSILNYLPFRLLEIKEDVSEFIIGIMYFGYLLGIIVSLTSTRIIEFFKNEKKAIISGLSFFIIFILMLFTKNFSIIFPAIFFLCGSLFWVHSISSGYVNKLAKENKGMVNALYVSFYYAGGALGSYFPGYLYVYFGWNIFLIFNIFLILILIPVAMGIKHQP
ncbi:MAG: MFS transporter [Proteobacteria bacterium]|nr:MFS transporter [Pseudomonadota bacterium]